MGEEKENMPIEETVEAGRKKGAGEENEKEQN